MYNKFSGIGGIKNKYFNKKGHIFGGKRYAIAINYGKNPQQNCEIMFSKTHFKYFIRFSSHMNEGYV